MREAAKSTVKPEVPVSHFRSSIWTYSNLLWDFSMMLLKKLFLSLVAFKSAYFSLNNSK